MADEPTPLLQASIQQRVSIVVPAIVFLAFSWVTVLLRLYTRGVLVKAYGWDDFSIVFTLLVFTLFNVGLIICAYAATKNPNEERHIAVPEAKIAIVWLQVALGSYVATMVVLKISIAIFYLRIMVHRWQRNVIYVSLAVITIFSVAYFFFAIFQCGPHSTTDPLVFMDRKLADKCMTHPQILGASYAHGAITSTTDMIFAFLPVVMLRRSNMRAREKALVMFILTLASIGGIASMVRMNYIKRLATATVSWFQEANMIAIWSTVEPGLGISAASLATLRPLLRKVLPTSSLRSSERQTGNWYRTESVKSVPVARAQEVDVKHFEHAYHRDMWDARRGNWDDDLELQSQNSQVLLHAR